MKSNANPFLLQSYQFELPSELIAKYPVSPRDSSRLMLVDRKKGQISEIVFRDLIDLLSEGDSLVFNNTKVIPARLMGKKAISGGEFEILLSKEIEKDLWEIVARPGRRLHDGTIIQFSHNFSCTIAGKLPDGRLTARFNYEGDFHALLHQHGEMPLPHYIGRRYEPKIDFESYQTVYAENSGAVAAPTAGLHFTPQLLESLHKNGVEQNFLTLHVGLGTFQPLKADDIRDHQMHSEACWISEETAERLNAHVKHKRQICVGTTTCRALEAASSESGKIKSGTFDNRIYIYPGYEFKYVQSLLTNFHLPGSSLLLLVSAFAGYDLIREAYEKAVKEGFRFYSYGDAMLIL